MPVLLGYPFLLPSLSFPWTFICLSPFISFPRLFLFSTLLSFCILHLLFSSLCLILSVLEFLKAKRCQCCWIPVSPLISFLSLEFHPFNSSSISFPELLLFSTLLSFSTLHLIFSSLCFILPLLEFCSCSSDSDYYKINSSKQLLAGVTIDIKILILIF